MTDPNRSKPSPAPVAAVSAPAARSHLAVVDPAAGAAGTPTPSERQGYLIAQLRKGEPPRGWVVALAKRWGLSHSALSEEIAAARALLEQSRSPEAAAVLAHELIVQAVELGEKVQKLSAAPPSNPATEAALVRRARGLAEVAKIKPKAAATLRQIHNLGDDGGFGRKGRAAWGAAIGLAGLRDSPPPLTREALCGETPPDKGRPPKAG